MPRLRAYVARPVLPIRPCHSRRHADEWWRTSTALVPDWVLARTLRHTAASRTGIFGEDVVAHTEAPRLSRSYRRWVVQSQPGRFTVDATKQIDARNVTQAPPRAACLGSHTAARGVTDA